MVRSFSEIMLFQVKPGKLEEFETLISTIQVEQEKLPGCISAKYMKRFYTFDGVENGNPPRKLTKNVEINKDFKRKAGTSWIKTNGKKHLKLWRIALGTII